MSAAHVAGAPLLLCYHGVSESWPAALAVTPDHLRQHVALLTKRGYRGVGFHEAVTASPGARAVAITFDDALRSVIELGLPVLADAGFVATVFAPTNFVGTGRPVSWPGVDHWDETPHREELEPMSWEELQTLADLGWEVGSHTRSHPRLTEIDDAALEAELVGSRVEIEDRLGRHCGSLAYPYGDHDARVVAATERAGYSAAGTLPGRLRPASGPLDMPRLGVHRADDARRFRLKTAPAMRRLRASRAWDAVSPLNRLAGRIRA